MIKLFPVVLFLIFSGCTEPENHGNKFNCSEPKVWMEFAYTINNNSDPYSNTANEDICIDQNKKIIPEDLDNVEIAIKKKYGKNLPWKYINGKKVISDFNSMIYFLRVNDSLLLLNKAIFTDLIDLHDVNVLLIETQNAHK